VPSDLGDLLELLDGAGERWTVAATIRIWREDELRRLSETLTPA
jgi:hypothetical protein